MKIFESLKSKIKEKVSNFTADKQINYLHLFEDILKAADNHLSVIQKMSNGYHPVESMIENFSPDAYISRIDAEILSHIYRSEDTISSFLHDAVMYDLSSFKFLTGKEYAVLICGIIAKTAVHKKITEKTVIKNLMMRYASDDENQTCFTEILKRYLSFCGEQMFQKEQASQKTPEPEPQTEHTAKTESFSKKTVEPEPKAEQHQNQKSNRYKNKDKDWQPEYVDDGRESDVSGSKLIINVLFQYRIHGPASLNAFIRRQKTLRMLFTSVLITAVSIGSIYFLNAFNVLSELKISSENNILIYLLIGLAGLFVFLINVLRFYYNKRAAVNLRETIALISISYKLDKQYLYHIFHEKYGSKISYLMKA